MTPLKQPRGSNGLLARVLADDKALCRLAFLGAMLALLGVDARTIVAVVSGAPSLTVTAATPKPSPTP